MNNVISLWSGPRNLSTAMMYSMAQRPDTQVVDEPFFGVFLKRYPNVYRPSRAEAMACMPLESTQVLKQLAPLACAKENLFLKNMVNHWPLVNWEEKKNWRHIFLFRHPHAVISSFSKQVTKPQLFDLGYAEQLNAILELEQAGIPFYLLQSENILKDPQKELVALCHFLKIPFSLKMLSWQASPRPEDGVWAKYWYQSIHRSTGFAPYQEKELSLDAHLQALADEAELYYQKILYYL